MESFLFTKANLFQIEGENGDDSIWYILAHNKKQQKYHTFSNNNSGIVGIKVTPPTKVQTLLFFLPKMRREKREVGK